MSIISKETFDKFSEEEKQNVRSHYEAFDEPMLIRSYADLFGEESLQPKPKIRTWEDVEKTNPEHFSRSNTPNPMLIQSAELRDKLLKKTMATYKIATLIELGYGGMVTNEEWKNGDIRKFSVIRFEVNLSYAEGRGAYEFVSFHTPEQREEFMSYPENRKLVEQYHMI